MDSSFAEQLRAARDGMLTPFESWRNKVAAGIPRVLELWFIPHFEYLREEDWRSALLAAARSGARYAELHYRVQTLGQEDAVRLWIEYDRAYLAPLQTAGVLGGPYALPYRKDKTGIVGLSLYPLKDQPPEDRREISAEKVHAHLRGLGFEKHTLPDATRQ